MLPVAVTEKVALPPMSADCAAGWAVIDGAPTVEAASVTARRALAVAVGSALKNVSPVSVWS